ncbi:MAG TPA: type II toxin-antitoxin system RelE/ParE family toxin [Candidatus Angelobacter sp.]|nr:type II toxin-antitoxin system RelE/ParE family toxin [Candidatus Angelobacter sp.]
MSEDEEVFQPAQICWEGNSKETLARFPDSVRSDLGFSLWQLQQGKLPVSGTRRMASVGAGVWELKEQDERAWYRVLYVSRIDNVIYVLHCFEKQSRKTDHRDLEIARERLKLVRNRIQEKKGHAKKAE